MLGFWVRVRIGNLIGGAAGAHILMTSYACASAVESHMCNSHTIHEIETLLIIENENFESQLQSANSAPIRTTFIQRMKKMCKTAGDP